MRKNKIYGKILFTLVLCLSVFIACSDDGGTFPDSNSQGVMGGSMARFTISGDYLYTVDNSTMKTFDLSVPEVPQYLSRKDQNLGFDIETIFATDTLLFIGSQDGMYIYNIARPDFPQYMSMAQHIRSCDPVVAKGGYAYITLNSENTWCGSQSNMLNIYNVSDPYSPELAYSMERGFMSPKGLGIDNNKLFICDNGIKVFNINNPERPVWIDDLTHIPEADGIETYDVIPYNGLLLVSATEGLYQFDYTGDKLAFVSSMKIKGGN